MASRLADKYLVKLLGFAILFTLSALANDIPDDLSPAARKVWTQFFGSPPDSSEVREIVWKIMTRTFVDKELKTAVEEFLNHPEVVKRYLNGEEFFSQLKTELDEIVLEFLEKNAIDPNPRGWLLKSLASLRTLEEKGKTPENIARARAYNTLHSTMRGFYPDESSFQNAIGMELSRTYNRLVEDHIENPHPDHTLDHKKIYNWMTKTITEIENKRVVLFKEMLKIYLEHFKTSFVIRHAVEDPNGGWIGANGKSYEKSFLQLNLSNLNKYDFQIRERQNTIGNFDIINKSTGKSIPHVETHIDGDVLKNSVIDDLNIKFDPIRLAAQAKFAALHQLDKDLLEAANILKYIDIKQKPSLIYNIIRKSFTNRLEKDLFHSYHYVYDLFSLRNTRFSFEFGELVAPDSEIRKMINLLWWGKLQNPDYWGFESVFGDSDKKKSKSGGPKLTRLQDAYKKALNSIKERVGRIQSKSKELFSKVAKRPKVSSSIFEIHFSTEIFHFNGVPKTKHLFYHLHNPDQSVEKEIFTNLGTEAGEITFSSSVPNQVVDRYLAIPTLDGTIIKTLTVKDLSGATLALGEDYQIVGDKNFSGYYIELLKDFTGSQFKLEGSFSKLPPSQIKKIPLPKLNLEALKKAIVNLEKAGFEAIVTGLKQKIKIAGDQMTLRDVFNIFSKTSRYTFIPAKPLSYVPGMERNLAQALSRFERAGRLCGQCDSSHALFVAFMREYLSYAGSDIYTYVRSGFSAINGSLRRGRLHAQSIFYNKNGQATLEDITPGRFDHRNWYNLWGLLRPKNQLSYGQESKVENVVNRIRASRDNLQYLVKKHKKSDLRLPVIRTLQSMRALEEYLLGTIGHDDLAIVLAYIYPNHEQLENDSGVRGIQSFFQRVLASEQKRFDALSDKQTKSKRNRYIYDPNIETAVTDVLKTMSRESYADLDLVAAREVDLKSAKREMSFPMEACLKKARQFGK